MTLAAAAGQDTRMPTVEFTKHLSQLAPEKFSVPGGTVRQALEAVFAQVPLLRGYVLDDQGEPRKHIAIFADGAPVRDRAGLSDALGTRSEVFVMQALSGG